MGIKFKGKRKFNGIRNLIPTPFGKEPSPFGLLRFLGKSSFLSQTKKVSFQNNKNNKIIIKEEVINPKWDLQIIPKGVA